MTTRFLDILTTMPTELELIEKMIQMYFIMQGAVIIDNIIRGSPKKIGYLLKIYL